ncbi:hypothetical protein M1N24_02540, partial [Dehalococcoidia bacterium]|nr:hypothetical protein [Dehalococcoidia bacterium]
FKELQSNLRLFDQVKFDPTPVQAFDSSTKFDIILLHNSVNHLNEEACMNLQHDNTARDTYGMIFQRLSGLARSGTKFIVTDCSRHNFFNLLNLKNPWSPTIEWHKHQSPKFWANLLQDAGFHSPKIRWTGINRLHSLGRFPIGTMAGSYFFRSHFCLVMEKK